MELGDLEKFLNIAASGNLQKSAEQLHLTPGALSKSIKRLESSLQTTLFDRIGRQLQLNREGERLQVLAQDLVARAKRTQNEFLGENIRFRCRIAAPAILQRRWTTPIARFFSQHYPDSGMDISTVYEEQALSMLKRGEVDVALVTGEVLPTQAQGIEFQMLETMNYQVAIGAAHPLLKNGVAEVSIHARDTRDLDFVGLTESAFCGRNQNLGNDGWRDDKLPRHLRYRVDDIAILAQLVHDGLAVAYVPEFIRHMIGAKRLVIQDCPYQCKEIAYFAYRPEFCSGWLSHLKDQLTVLTTPYEAA